MVYIFWSCRAVVEAKKVIYDLLEKHLIACASIFPQVESIYRWEGEIEESHEVKVIFKTESKNFDLIEKTIQTHGSYEVPEIVQIESSCVNDRYLSWLKKELLCGRQK